MLNAEELLFVARHDLSEAKLKYLLSRLRLASSVGSLGDDDINQVNAYLGPELQGTTAASAPAPVGAALATKQAPR